MSVARPQPAATWRGALGLGLVGTLAVALVVLAFLWPAKTMTPQHLPISITGPAAAVAALEHAVTARSADTFTFVRATDRAAAVTQIETRETDGGIVLGDGATPPEVLTAPASSAAATQILTGVAGQLQAQLTQQVTATGGNPASATVTLTPVVPLAAGDPTGNGLTASSFPLTIGGMLGGILVTLVVVGAGRRVVALAGFGVGVGVVLTVVLQTWFQFLQGSFWANATAIGLSVLATSAFLVGCASLLGRRGLVLGALLTLLVANPIASPAAPWQFLPEPWGAIGQLGVPGASSRLIRSLSYFPDTHLAPLWWTLVGWTVLGLALTLVGHRRDRAATRGITAAPRRSAPQPAES